MICFELQHLFSTFEVRVDLEVGDLFDAEDETLFEEQKEKAREMLGKYSAGPRPSRKLTKRRFLSRAATRATMRLSGNIRRDQDGGSKVRRDIFRLLAPMLVGKHLCYICTVRLTFEAHTRRDPKRSTRTRDMVPTNFSPDAIVPRKRGGNYSKGNMGRSCMGCNIIKRGYPLGNAKALIAALGRDVPKVDSNGRLVAANYARPNLESSDISYIKFWAHKQHKQLSREHRKACLLRVQDIEMIVKQAYAGEGFIRETSGITLPFPCLGIDRINPAKPYELGNCRLLEIGENILRTSDETDQRIIRWRTYVNQNLASIETTAKVPGASAYKLFCRQSKFDFDSDHSEEECALRTGS